jgi:DNA-binding MarR family transcriptional regulator
MPERYRKYKRLEEQMHIVKGFFSEYFRQTISKNGIDDKVDFTIMELKGISAFIDETKEYTMSELGNNAHLPLSNMTSIVDRLARKGIVRRRRDPKDRRVVRVRLTDKGKKMLHEFMKKRGQELENSLGGLSEKDRRDLFKALAKATKIFQKIKYQEKI